MKKYFQSGIILVLILWLFGAMIYLPSTEGKLQEAARVKLAAAKGGVFAKVSAEFSGQQAILTGAVATAAEKAQAQALIENHLRLPGWFTGNMNPVTGVTNHIAVDPEHAPFRPQPWLILTLYGGNQRLDGVLPSAGQRQDLLSTIVSKLPPPVTPLNDQIAVAETALAATNWEATQAEVPDLTATPNEERAIAVTTCDGKWSTLPATATDAEIAAALKASKVPGSNRGGWSPGWRSAPQVSVRVCAAASRSVRPLPLANRQSHGSSAIAGWRLPRSASGARSR